MINTFSNRFLKPGFLLGLGLGGFVDGIVFHQVLQYHSMLSAKLPQDDLNNVKISMFWDGVFHSFTFLVTIFGLYLLWKLIHQKEPSPSGKYFIGAMLLGWGSFNVIEGILDHYIFQIHHVVERAGLSVYDHIFIGASLLLILAGYTLMKGSSLQDKGPH
jgi:uncharacterized membrane protein